MRPSTPLATRTLARPLRGQSARDLPEIRAWMVSELSDSGRLWLSMMQMEAYLTANKAPSPTTVEFERAALEQAELFWIPESTCKIIEAAVPTLPPDLCLDEASLPYPSGFAIFEVPLSGTMSMIDYDATIALLYAHNPDDGTVTIENNVTARTLRAFRWGLIDLPPIGDHSEARRGVGLSWWSHSSEFDPSAIAPYLSSLRMDAAWLPLGRTDWCFGQRWDEVETAHLPESHDRDDFVRCSIEDRARVMALWALMNTQRPIVSRPQRQERRQAERRAVAGDLDVHVVLWDPVRHERESDEPTSGRKVNVRYEVDAFWRKQACGPKRSQRRWTYVPSHWRGPVDAPVKPKTARVRKVKGGES